MFDCLLFVLVHGLVTEHCQEYVSKTSKSKPLKGFPDDVFLRYQPCPIISQAK